MEELHTAIRDVPKPVIAARAGLRHRRRQRAGTICDLTICSDKGQFGPGRPEDGLGRSRLRHRLPGARGRRRGARDLVPEPSLFSGAGGRGHGPGQHLRAARPAGRRVQKWARPSASAAHGHRHRQAQLQHGHRRTRPASPAWACWRSSCTTTPTSRARAGALKEKRKPSSASTSSKRQAQPV